MLKKLANGVLIVAFICCIINVAFAADPRTYVTTACGGGAANPHLVYAPCDDCAKNSDCEYLKGADWRLVQDCIGGLKCTYCRCGWGEQ